MRAAVESKRASDDFEVRLRRSAQRALLGNLPAALRAVSLGIDGEMILFHAVFAPGASDDDRDSLSTAAAEVIADFPAPFTLRETYLEVAPPASPPRLEFLVFLRPEGNQG